MVLDHVNPDRPRMKSTVPPPSHREFAVLSQLPAHGLGVQSAFTQSFSLCLVEEKNLGDANDENQTTCTQTCKETRIYIRKRSLSDPQDLHVFLKKYFCANFSNSYLVSLVLEVASRGLAPRLVIYGLEMFGKYCLASLVPPRAGT